MVEHPFTVIYCSGVRTAGFNPLDSTSATTMTATLQILRNMLHTRSPQDRCSRWLPQPTDPPTVADRQNHRNPSQTQFVGFRGALCIFSEIQREGPAGNSTSTVDGRSIQTPVSTRLAWADASICFYCGFDVVQSSEGHAPLCPTCLNSWRPFVGPDASSRCCSARLVASQTPWRISPCSTRVVPRSFNQRATDPLCLSRMRILAL